MNLQKERKLEEIDNDWLTALPENQLKAVLLVVNAISYLNEWLVLNENRHSDEVINYLKHIPSDKIIEVSESGSFYYPFSVRDAYDIITNSTNK